MNGNRRPAPAWVADESSAPRPSTPAESEKERTDRQLVELLNELRVALPGAQVLLGFLLTVPFATRFGKVSHDDRITLFVCFVLTTMGTLLLMAPSVYHRLRWGKGGKSDVIRVAHVMFLGGTALLGFGVLAASYLVTDVLFGTLAAGATTGLIGITLFVAWYLVPLTRGCAPGVRNRE